MNSNSNELNKPDVPDSLNQDELKGMEFVANMRASADAALCTRCDQHAGHDFRL